MAAGLGFKTFNTGDVLSAADTNGYLMQGVFVFADAAARTTAITSPQEGNMSYLKDTNSTEYYSGSAWVAVGAAGGGMTLISETSASALSSLSFSSLGSYKQLLLMWNGIVHSTSSTAFNIRLNNDSASNYTIKQVFSNNTSVSTLNASYTSLNGDNNAGFGYDVTSASIQNQSGGWIKIDNYTSTTKFKEYIGQWGYIDGGGTKNDVLSNTGTYRSTSAITSIDIVRSTGSATFSNTANTTIRLYGIN
jgi:hypothetical protein